MAEVVLSPEAIDDIIAIYHYIAERDGQEQAEAIVARLENRAQSLANLPLRSKLPEELLAFGNRRIRELVESPWRIFYLVEGDTALVLHVLDGRRTLDELLHHYLLQ